MNPEPEEEFCVTLSKIAVAVIAVPLTLPSICTLSPTLIPEIELVLLPFFTSVALLASTVYVVPLFPVTVRLEPFTLAIVPAIEGEAMGRVPLAYGSVPLGI